MISPRDARSLPAVRRPGDRALIGTGHVMMLKPVKHPRLWLLGAITAFTAVTAILIAGVFFPELLNRKLVWGVFVPLSLASWWPMSVWRRAYDRARRISRGNCAYCDYDLTGNTSGICPECGQPVAPAATR